MKKKNVLKAPPRISFQKTVRLIDNTSKIVHFDKNPDGKMSLFFSFLLQYPGAFLGHSCKPGATAECVSMLSRSFKDEGCCLCTCFTRKYKEISHQVFKYPHAKSLL